jgi:dihydroflavonol-4-reductase
MKKVCITGANGLLGSQLAADMLSAGWQVRAIIRSGADTSLLTDIISQMEIVEGDIMDIQLVHKAIADCDYVVHAAAVVSFAARSRDTMYRTNIDGTAHIVDALLDYPGIKLAYISSIAAIGRPKDAATTVLHEDLLWEESSSNTHYAISKYKAEQEVWRGIEEGMNAVILNPSIILGPGRLDSSSTKLFDYVKKGSKYYNLGHLNVVDLRDVSRACMLLLTSDRSAERYIISAGAVPQLQLFEMMATYFQVKAPYIIPKKWMLQWAIAIESVRTYFSHREPLITRETAQVGAMQIQYDNTKLKKSFPDFEYYSITDTISWTCRSLLDRE